MNHYNIYQDIVQYSRKRTRLILTFSMIIWAFSSQAQQILQQNIKLNKVQGNVLQILQDLQQNPNLLFSYDERALPGTTIHLKKKDWVLKNLLKQLGELSNLAFKLTNGLIIVKKRKKGKYTLSGIIKGQNDGEYLPGATIYVKELHKGTVSNAYGFYSFTIPPGEYTLVFSFIGFQTKQHKIKLIKDQALSIDLLPEISELSEITIKVKQEEDLESIESVQMSAHTMKVARIKSTPTLAGEADVLKSIQYLPGIQSPAQGTAGFSVRGGSFDQNLILLDEAPIYNLSHSMGLFSVFNVDAIKNVQVYKGAIPAKYGGRLASVVDIQMKDGNNQRFSANGGLGFIGSRLTLEGPIGKQTSFLVAGRYGYPSFTINKFVEIISRIEPQIPNQIKQLGTNNQISFYDLNAKINTRINDKNKVYLSAFVSNDHFFSNLILEKNTLDWSNQTITFRWNHIFNQKLFSNVSLIYSNFDYAYQINNDTRDFGWQANLQQAGAKVDFDYFAHTNHTLRFGFAFHKHRFSPGKITPLSDSSSIRPLSLEVKPAFESGFYISHEWQPDKKVLINYGLRVSSFHNVGPGIQYTHTDRGQIKEESFGNGEIMHSYYNFAPRVSARWLLSSQASIKAFYNRTFQYLHLVSNSTVGLPTDVWLPVDNNIQPRRSDQVGLGYFLEFRQSNYLFSAEVYHKWLSQVIDYKDNADLFLNKNIETQIRAGSGKAYGVELMIEKRKGKLTGLVSYTLSKVEQTIEGVNRGRTYAPRQDRRHNLSLLATYKLGKRWEVSANYTYITGIGITVPQGVFPARGSLFLYYTERNAFRLPDFHQLDLSIKLKSKPVKATSRRKWRGEWVLGITNVYNQKNPLTYYMNFYKVPSNHINPGLAGNGEVYQLYLFGFMPSLTYNFRF